MPTTSVPNYDGANALTDAIAKLEADGHRIISFANVGDQYVILHEPKPKPGRPKIEKR